MKVNYLRACFTGNVKRGVADYGPYYILVDRQGKAEGRPDIRNNDRYIEAIKSKL